MRWNGARLLQKCMFVAFSNVSSHLKLGRLLVLWYLPSYCFLLRDCQAPNFRRDKPSPTFLEMRGHTLPGKEDQARTAIGCPKHSNGNSAAVPQPGVSVCLCVCVRVEGTFAQVDLKRKAGTPFCCPSYSCAQLHTEDSAAPRAGRGFPGEYGASRSSSSVRC